MIYVFVAFLFIMSFGIGFSQHDTKNLELLAITVASHENDGLVRLRRSASVYGINLQELIDNEWTEEKGFVQKIYFARKYIEKFKNRSNLVILVIDAYNVIFNAGEEEILDKFLKFEANIVFGAEINNICGEEAVKFEETAKNEKLKYLNSGGYIGYAPYIYRLLSLDTGGELDDQCLMSRYFLDPNIQKELKIVLDYKGQIISNIYAIEGDLDLEFLENDTRLVNTLFNTRPAIIHGNGLYGKRAIKRYGNYVAKSWTPSKGCLICKEGRIDLNSTSKSDYPSVLVGIFVNEKTPFLEEMLNKVARQIYPKEKLFLYIYNNEPFHEKQINDWILSHKSKYSFVEFTSSFQNISLGLASNFAIKLCTQLSCDVFFNVLSEVHLENPNTLSLLISYNRTILAPVMRRGNSYFSNFWGDEKAFYYRRSFDYMDIVDGDRRGIWCVAYIYAAYVIWSEMFENPKKGISYIHKDNNEADMAFVINNHIYQNNNFMYAVNLENYGHLVNMEYETSEDEMNILRVKKNPKEWEDRYIHTQYYGALKNKTGIKEICSDVFTFPVFSKSFSKDILQLFYNREKENRKDDENQITIVDKTSNKINLSYINIEEDWKVIVKKYMEPIINSIFIGYNGAGNPSTSFIRVLRPINETSLPRLDPAIYTVVIALNTPEIDYLGGGIQFIGSLKKVCVAPPTQSGWVTLYPGQPTHYHQEIRVKAGFKYELVYYAD